MSDDWTLPDPAGEARQDGADSKPQDKRPTIASAAQARAVMQGRLDARLNAAEAKPASVTSAAAARLAMLRRGGR